MVADGPGGEVVPRLAFYGAALLFAVMLGAAYTHFVGRDGLNILRPFIFMFALYLIARGRSLGKKKAAR